MTVGPVCYSLVAEISSPRLRNKTVVLARNLYNVTGVVANVLTPHMLNPDAWKWDAKAGSFWAGTGACVRKTKSKRTNETYSSRDSHVVTHRSTNLPFNCLCMAERTGCPVFS
ncbi:hypothetical protein KCU71_g7449, partial [Aureobasidium melanogenum]